ncbi:hypothetical protein CG740_37270 [Streptomyces sp. CB01201]|uniref:hypothetical protein n=1 Tax=Streptomyces sp. CB01201 TaxID=2020324 RepID=UPI000C271AE4|nr:hypothetical protein [Streptomyces sp. CB01201]PJM98137.1 hypothetical protein CG740_37270 [Streptomyces sp. CB01201]
MSSVYETTEYQFSFTINAETGENDGGFTLTTAAGVNDEIALGIVAAFNAQPWPHGVVNPMSVLKQDLENRVYSTNLNATPPNFS